MLSWSSVRSFGRSHWILQTGALFLLWLVVRVLLVVSGGELGTAKNIELSDSSGSVSALLFQGTVPAQTLVVVTHGGLASKETLMVACWEARQQGADCLAVDSLGHGYSSVIPSQDALIEMRDALRLRSLVGNYKSVRFLGHSMGAALGCYAVYPCVQSVSIGQPVACPPHRIVYGDLHRRLGLPDAFYLPVTHVLEPWTPSVMRQAVGKILPQKEAAKSRISLWISLSWLSFALAIAWGLSLTKAIRGTGWPSWVRGLVSATVVWCSLALGAWRTLWFLVPSQVSDAILIATIVGISFAIAKGWQWLGLEGNGGLLGVMSAFLVTEALAVVVRVMCPVPMLQLLLGLIPWLLIPVTLAIACAERWSRGSASDIVESTLFTGGLLAVFLALLVPAWQ
jgi:pimeloyl-ACP methyl ester carboxylesterase